MTNRTYRRLTYIALIIAIVTIVQAHRVVRQMRAEVESLKTKQPIGKTIYFGNRHPCTTTYFDDETSETTKGKP